MDQVQIVAIGSNTNLPMWATEKAQEEMIKLMKDHYEIDEKNSDELKKAFDKYVKDEEKSGNDREKHLSDILKTLKKIEDKEKTDGTGRPKANGTARQPQQPRGNSRSNDRVLRDLDELHDNLVTAEEARTRNTDAVNDSSKAFRSNTDIIKGFASDTMEDIKAAYNYLTEQGTVYRDIYKNGLLMSGELAGMNEEVNATRMTLAQYSKVMSENSSVINHFGRNVFAETVGDITDSLQRFGVTGEDAAEYLGNYLDAQRLLGMTEQMNARKAAQQTKKELKTAQLFSQALGESTKQIQEQMNAARLEVDARMILARLPEELREGVGKNIAVVGAYGEDVRNIILEGMRDQEMAIDTDFVKGLYAMDRGDVAEEYMAFIKDAQKGEMSPEEITRRFGEIFGDLNLGAEHLSAVLKGQQISHDTLTKYAIMQDAATKTNEQVMKELSAQGKDGDSIVGSQTKAESTENRLVSALDALKTSFFSPELLEKLTTAFENLATMFEEKTVWIKDKLDLLGTGISDAIESPEGVVAALLGAFVALKGVGALISTKVGDKISEYINFKPPATSGGVDGPDKLWTKLLKGAGSLVKKIPIIGWILGAGVGAVTGAMETEGNDLEGALIGMFEGVVVDTVWLGAWITDLFFGTNFADSVDTMWDGIKGDLHKEGIGDYFVNKYKDMVNSITSKFEDLGWWFSKKLLQLKLGILEAIEWSGAVDGDLAITRGQISEIDLKQKEKEQKAIEIAKPEPKQEPEEVKPNVPFSPLIDAEERAEAAGINTEGMEAQLQAMTNILINQNDLTNDLIRKVENNL